MKTLTLHSVSQRTTATQGRSCSFGRCPRIAPSLFVVCIAILLSLFSSQKTFAQGVAISTAASPTPDANAVLDLQGTKGLKLPPLSADPAGSNGLFYFNTGSNNSFLKYYSTPSTTWYPILGFSGTLTLGGIAYVNSLTTTSTMATLAPNATAGLILMNNASAAPSWSLLSGLPTSAGILPIANGGTGSSTQGWVDMSNTQASCGGAKTWSALGTFTGGITATGTTAISLGADNTTKTITLGNTTAGTVSQTNINAGTGGLNLGTTADARTIAIGTAAAIQTINIGTGAVANVITIGSTSAAAGVSISGTTNASNATAGFVGEVLTATTAANTTSLTTATSANVLSTALSLTAGDWDVWGVVNYTPAATTSITITSAGISTTSITLGAQDSYYRNIRAAFVPTALVITEAIPMQRVNVSSTTNVYLVSNCTFTASTLKAGGTLWARRCR